MSLSRTIRRAGTMAGMVALAVGGTALPANAADFVFPSCPGFDVGLTPLTNHGNPEQAGPRVVISAGSGTSILDNESTGASIPFHGAGNFKVEENPDGTVTLMSSGRSVLFLFDTDPGGPATILFTGRLVTRGNQDGTVEVISHTGRAIDLCAALGG